MYLAHLGLWSYYGKQPLIQLLLHSDSVSTWVFVCVHSSFTPVTVGDIAMVWAEGTVAG